jgi:hypothetical protein
MELLLYKKNLHSFEDLSKKEGYQSRDLRIWGHMRRRQEQCSEKSIVNAGEVWGCAMNSK